MSEGIVVEDAIMSLERMQNFVADDLIQRDKLGDAFSFESAVDPANRLISLFSKLPKDALFEFPAEQLVVVKELSDSTYNLFQQVLTFNSRSADAEGQHTSLLTNLASVYQPTFNRIFPLISYSVARTADFGKLSQDGRAAVQSVRDETSSALKEIKATSETAAEILRGVQAAAAEQGVTQQASYFKAEADKHAATSESWRKWTVRVAFALGCYGIATLFFHKWSWLAPKNTSEAIQFTASKLLIFFVLSFLLFLCSRNFMSNRHNEIVNRHRQNALMTYKALADAGGTAEARDVVLSHAASAIYKLHDTGYAKTSDGNSGSSASIIEMIPKMTMPVNMG